MKTELSPAAQAVLDAAFPVYDDEHLYVATGEQHAGMIAAFALRAAADQVVRETTTPWNSTLTPIISVQEVRTQLLAIVAELEGFN